jgi:ABC-type methionine transport system ATPase subunit
MIRLKGIVKRYDTTTNTPPIINQLHGQFTPGSIVAISGPSGIGKSTLLRIIGLLEECDQGDIHLKQQVVDFKDRAQIKQHRQRCSFIFQDYALLQFKSVLDNVALPLLCRGESNKKARQAAQRILDELQVGHLAHRFVDSLSGGQQQRVAIARALVTKPEILLCDEPTSALDHKTTQSIIQCLRTLRDRHAITVIIVTHSPYVANELADASYALDDGKLTLTHRRTHRNHYATPA